MVLLTSAFWALNLLNTGGQLGKPESKQLDYANCNIGWHSRFQENVVKHLAHGYSNYHPLLISTSRFGLFLRVLSPSSFKLCGLSTTINYFWAKH